MKYVDRKHVKYHDMTEGEPRELPIGARRLEACCDCGLVHVHDYAVENKTIQERVYRDNRATAQLRRKMARGGNLIKEAASNVYILPLRIQRKRGIKRLNVVIEPGDPNETADRNPTIHNRRASHASRRQGNDRKRARGAR